MAPTRAQKTSLQADSKTATPPRGITKRITQRQKQALIDNLQLEITERARKLRAQYALQAHTLRSRVELRVNRIQNSLRKAIIGELLEKHLATLQSESKAISKPTKKASSKQPTTANQKATSSPVVKRGVKRTSEAMVHDDKENTPDPGLPIQPEKRRAMGGNAVKNTTRDTSNVLSPKSSNARNLLQSPARPNLLSHKSGNASRPQSPLKPTASAKAATANATSMLASMVSEKTQNIGKSITAGTRKAGRAPTETKASSTRAKREIGHPVERVTSNSSTVSGSSAMSTGTTIVKRVGNALNVSKTTVKKTTASTAPKRAAATKAKPDAASATGSRVLRKRA